MPKWIKNWFSNMLECDKPIIDDDGISHKTVENMYQAAKCARMPDREAIAKMNPYDAKRKVKDFEYRPDWSLGKLIVMRKALNQKFARGTTWRTRLDASKGEIVETNNWHDNYWGNCVCSRCKSGTGQNHLGKMLMEIRDGGE